MQQNPTNSYNLICPCSAATSESRPEPLGTQRHPLRRRTRLQVAWITRALWQLAHHLHPNEQMVQERGAGSSIRTTPARGDSQGQTRSRLPRQHLGQGASGRHRHIEKNGPQSIGKSRGGWNTKWSIWDFLRSPSSSMSCAVSTHPNQSIYIQCRLRWNG